MSLRRPLLLVLIVLISFPIGARLVGSTTTETALGQVSFSIRPAIYGGAEFFVPITEWGMRFHVTKTPFLVRVEPRSVDRQAALEVAAGNRSLLEASKRDLRGGLLRNLVLTVLTVLLVSLTLSLGGAALLALPIREVAIQAVAGCLALVAVLGLLGWATFSPEALQSPSLYARGAELKQLIETVERERADSPGSYSGNFERVLRGASSFLAAAPGKPDGTREALLASDVHNNAPALQAIAEMSDGIPVFMPGDFGFQGSDTEASLLSSQISALGPDVVATSGNHDSAGLMLSLAHKGVIVLGQRGRLAPDGSWQGPVVQKIAGMRVAGYRDPLEWRGSDPEDPQRVFSFSELADGEARTRAAEASLWEWWQSLKVKPDLLLVHQPELAEGLARRISESQPGQELTILVGHDHRQWLSRYGSVSIVDGGSAGAGGLFGIGSEAAEIATLHFRSSSDDLEAADFIAVEPLGGASRAERVILEEICPDSCTYRIREILGAGLAGR